MGSPGGAAHSPRYMSPPHGGARTAWPDGAEDIKLPRGLLPLPDRSWTGVYLPYYDRLAVEENPWIMRMTEAPAHVPPPCRALEPSPAKPGPPQEPPEATGGQVEECCLEQVQTMVVGEVLKDVDTACKLLNIAPGGTQLLYVV